MRFLSYPDTGTGRTRLYFFAEQADDAYTGKRRIG